MPDLGQQIKEPSCRTRPGITGDGAVEKSRTSTGSPPQRPQRCASTIPPRPRGARPKKRHAYCENERIETCADVQALASHSRRVRIGRELLGTPITFRWGESEFRYHRTPGEIWQPFKADYGEQSVLANRVQNSKEQS